MPKKHSKKTRDKISKALKAYYGRIRKGKAALPFGKGLTVRSHLTAHSDAVYDAYNKYGIHSKQLRTARERYHAARRAVVNSG